MTLPITPRLRSRIRKFVLLALGLFVALLVVGFVWTRVLARRAERTYPATGQTVTVDGARVHFVENGGNAPVVMLHGIYGGVQDFAATIFDPIAVRHHVIALDRPGHGWSDRIPNVVTPREQARIVHAALRELHVEHPIVVGFSFGGAVALAYALEYPDDTTGLFLINPVLREWPDPISFAYQLVGIPVLGPLFAHTWLMPLGQFQAREGVARSFAPADVPATFERSPVELSLRPATFLAISEDMRAIKASLTEMLPHWNEIHCPLVIVVGEGDQVTWPSHHSVPLRDAVPGAELVVVPGAGHQVLYSHTDRVLAAFTRLEELVAARATR